MTMEWSAITFDIGVAYKEDTDTVMKIMNEVGEELTRDPVLADLILEPIEVLGLDQFANNAMIIKARLKTRPNHQWAIGREYRKRLKAAFDLHKIEIPFPQTTLNWNPASSPIRIDPPGDKQT
jgi:small conductance mechanosensitive channel